MMAGAEILTLTGLGEKMDTLQYIRKGAPSLARGKFSYSDSNFTILALIVEAITQATAESKIREMILRHST